MTVLILWPERWLKLIHLLIQLWVITTATPKKALIPFIYSEEDGTFKGSFVVNRSDYGVTGVGMKAKFVGEAR